VPCTHQRRHVGLGLRQHVADHSRRLHKRRVLQVQLLGVRDTRSPRNIWVVRVHQSLGVHTYIDEAQFARTKRAPRQSSRTKVRPPHLSARIPSTSTSTRTLHVAIVNTYELEHLRRIIRACGKLENAEVEVRPAELVRVCLQRLRVVHQRLVSLRSIAARVKHHSREERQ
jgi:hypothetical protein